jgi:hypothetical protein
MSIRIPSNKIKVSYTSNGDFVIENTYQTYKGYYYELNNKFYTGKEYNATASLLIKKSSTSFNPLLTSLKTATYGILSNVIPQQLKVTSVPFSGNAGTRYFVKKANDNLIKEINKDDFQKAQNDPLYQTLEVNFSYNMSEQELSELDKKMPGIKIYLQDDINNIQTSSDETNPYISIPE